MPREILADGQARVPGPMQVGQRANGRGGGGDRGPVDVETHRPGCIVKRARHVQPLVVGKRGLKFRNLLAGVLDREGEDVAWTLEAEQVGVKAGTIVRSHDDHAQATGPRPERLGLDEGFQGQAASQGEPRAVGHRDSLTADAVELQGQCVGQQAPLRHVHPVDRPELRRAMQTAPGTVSDSSAIQRRGIGNALLEPPVPHNERRNVTCIAQAVPIGICLGGIGVQRAVVAAITFAISVAVFLAGIGGAGAVVAHVDSAVAIAVGLALIGDSVGIAVSTAASGQIARVRHPVGIAVHAEARGQIASVVCAVGVAVDHLAFVGSPIPVAVSWERVWLGQGQREVLASIDGRIPITRRTVVEGAVGVQCDVEVVRRGDGGVVIARWGGSFAGEVLPPGDNGAVGPQGQAVERPGGHGHEVAAGRRIRLAVVVVAPSRDGAVGAKAQAVVCPSGDGDEVVTSREGAIAAPEVHDRAIGSQSQALVIAGGDSHVAAGRRTDLAIPVVAPTDDRAVVPQGQAVEPARGHRLVVVARGHAGLAVVVASPADQRAVQPDGDGMVGPGRDGHEILAPRHAELAVVVVAPGHDAASARIHVTAVGHAVGIAVGSTAQSDIADVRHQVGVTVRTD